MRFRSRPLPPPGSVAPALPTSKSTTLCPRPGLWVRTPLSGPTPTCWPSIQSQLPSQSGTPAHWGKSLESTGGCLLRFFTSEWLAYPIIRYPPKRGQRRTPMGSPSKTNTTGQSKLLACPDVDAGCSVLRYGVGFEHRVRTDSLLDHPH